MEGEPLVDQWTAGDGIGGCREALMLLREIIAGLPKYGEVGRKLGIQPPQGLLLYGPPGTGKRSLVRAVVKETNANLITISPYMVLMAPAGEREKFLRDAFSDAFTKANSGVPSVILIDEIDIMCSRHDYREHQEVSLISQVAAEVPLTSQLAALMDSNRPSPSSVPHVVVIATSNRVEAIDPCLRHHGRFGAELEISAPTEAERVQILKFYTRRVRLDLSARLESVAALCKGYVGSDLHDLCREATENALRRCPDSFQDDFIPILMLEDWNHARSIVRPSITRDLTFEVPNVTWDDVGGLKDVKEMLHNVVEGSFKYPAAAFARLGISQIRGIVLHGPPGCSKTTLAKAAANSSQASFLSLSGRQLYLMRVEEGEELLRSAFRRARLAAPSILFFDEADVFGTKREGRSGCAFEPRVLSTLHTEMDRLKQSEGVMVLAATYQLKAFDDAFLRRGRFELAIYVPPPDEEARLEILRIHTRSMTIGEDVNLQEVAEHTEFFTGAELKLLCSNAGHAALREDMAAKAICGRHFQAAVRSIKPELKESEVPWYEWYAALSRGSHGKEDLRR